MKWYWFALIQFITFCMIGAVDPTGALIVVCSLGIIYVVFNKRKKKVKFPSDSEGLEKWKLYRDTGFSKDVLEAGK